MLDYDYKFKRISIEDLNEQLKKFKKDSIVSVTGTAETVLIIYKDYNKR